MPRTPAASRPMARTSVSLKRMVMPLRVTTKMSSSPDVATTRDQLVAVAQVDGDEALPAGLVVLAEGGLLHLALRGGEEQVLVGRELAGRDDGLDRLVGRQREQVDDGRAPWPCAPSSGSRGPQPVDLAPVGEEQQVGVGRGVDDLG